MCRISSSRSQRAAINHARPDSIFWMQSTRHAHAIESVYATGFIHKQVNSGSTGKTGLTGDV